MRRVRREDLSESSGQDSFLDIIANMVGILILLVMVVGARVSISVAEGIAQVENAQANLVSENPVSEKNIAKKKPEQATTLSMPRMKIKTPSKILVAQQQLSVFENKQQQNLQTYLAEENRKLEEESFRLKKQAAVAKVAYQEGVQQAKRAGEMNTERELRKQERQGILDLVVKLESDLDTQKKNLSEQERVNLESRIELAQAEERLEEITRLKLAVMENEDVKMIKNQPTPIVEVVKKKEVYLRVSKNGVSLIPNQQLSKMAIQAMEGTIRRLNNPNSFKGSLGPVQGYRLEYFFRRELVHAIAGSGLPSRGSREELFYGIIYQPISDDLGEPISQAVEPNSQLREDLRKYPAKNHVVTIWIYPDSYETFQPLKTMLIEELGYRIALRPLELGEPIMSANRGGTKSRTQ